MYEKGIPKLEVIAEYGKVYPYIVVHFLSDIYYDFIDKHKDLKSAENGLYKKEYEIYKYNDIKKIYEEVEI